MMNKFKSVVAIAALLTAAGAQASTWSLYDYVATLDSATTINGTSFAAGAQVTGQVYVLQGITPDSAGWGFGGEVARYVDSVNQFSFSTAGLSVVGTGAGNAEVDNNRRLTKRGTAYQDVFSAQLLTEPTTQFSGTSQGGGVTGVYFELRSPFLGGAPAATTSLALPGAVDVGLFGAQNDLRLSFGNGSALDATITSMTVSQVSQIPAVPEPSSAALVGLGLAGLALMRRRQHRA